MVEQESTSGIVRGMKEGELIRRGRGLSGEKVLYSGPNSQV
jgi:hypothetical protein